MTDVEHNLATYVSDMLALEEHILVPLQIQREDAEFRNITLAAAIVTRIASLAETHVLTLRSALDSLGGDAAHPAKSAFSNVESSFASAIDKLRKTKAAKGLRDDYTALALCTASYGMLLTTARAFGNGAVGELAKRHLQDYAQAIVDIADALPLVVADDLNQSGMPVDRRIAAQAQSEIRTAWRAGESATTTGTIESDATVNRAKNPTYPTI